MKEQVLKTWVLGRRKVFGITHMNRDRVVNYDQYLGKDFSHYLDYVLFVLEDISFMNKNWFLWNSPCPNFFLSLGLLLICMIGLENNLSSLFYTSDFLKVTWQVRDDIGHILLGSF